ncbi:MAG: type II 3-dehydroquinate dehydratase [Chloroflexi bacterium]|nr:type II 3-dehydroquinate dehydratase [Chloroflexota bacterium]
MMRILLINGPNLNMLGRREQAIYGSDTLDSVVKNLKNIAVSKDIELISFQSNDESEIVSFIQQNADSSQGIIINAGALTHYAFSLKDALLDASIPIVEVHISNIHSREEYRRDSVIAPIALGQIIGMGTKGYGYSLEFLSQYLDKN